MATKKATKKEQSLGATLKELEEIIAWFDAQESVDIDESLVRARRGAELVIAAEKQLAMAQNELKDLYQKLEGDT